MTGRRMARVPPMAGFGNLSRLRRFLLLLVLLPSLASGRRAKRREAAEERGARDDFPLREGAGLEEA